MISVTLSCEAAELPALRSLLELWLFGQTDATLRNVAKNNHGNIISRDGAARQEVATEQSQNVSNVSNVPDVPPKPYIMGTYPASFEEAPIGPKEPEPVRNKYGRYDSNVSPEIDAEILRLRAEGMDCREIAAEIEKSHGVSLHYRRVQGRLSTAGRQKNTLSTLQRMESYFSDKIDELILEFEFNDLSPAEISEKLKAEGASIPAEDIEARLKELHEARP